MAGASPGDEFDDVFGLLANETRIDIIRALWDEHDLDEALAPEPVPFSTLKERVGVRDSGRFHYHLDQLVPRFVRHHDDGYTLTYAGGKIVGAIISGIYTETDETLGPIATGDCPDTSCDGAIAREYEKGHVVEECDTCDLRRTAPAPPILVAAHESKRDPEVLQRFALTQLQKMTRGFCHLCNGPLDVKVDPAHLDREQRADESVRIVHECLECDAVSQTTAVSTVVDHPAVVSLLHDAGIDYRDTVFGERPRGVDTTETVLDDDPVRVEVSIAVEDDVLALVLDENLDVLEYGRG